METEIKQLLEQNNQLLRENNEMLKDIIAYINYVVAHGDQENRNDFLMDIAANLFANRIDGRVSNRL